MPLKMDRGRVGSLFRHMPEQTFNWEHQKGSFKGTGDVNAEDMNVPAAWMKRSLRRVVRPFAVAARDEGRSFSGLDTIERERFKLLQPTRLEAELFPRTYLCFRCDLFFEAADARTRTRCPDPKCGGHAGQWSFVEYHRCGYISGLKPPRECPRGHRRGMRLMNRRSRRFREWGWQCAECGIVAQRSVYRFSCPACRNGGTRISRPNAGPVYYTQHVTAVNPPSKADYSLLDTGEVYPAAVAQALGALPPGLDGLREGVNDGTTGDSLEAARRQLVEEYRLDESKEQDRLLLESLLSRKRAAIDERPDWNTAVRSLNLDEEHLMELGYQCVELALAREASPVTVNDLVAGAPSARHRAHYDVDYRDVLKKYGFAEATLLREFPMVRVVVGYTREANRPEPGVVFNFFGSSGGAVPMYGQRTETEALLFRLDPHKAVRWLVDSGVVDDPGDVDSQAWVFQNTGLVPDIFNPPDDPVTTAVLGLVHSVCHRTLKAVAVKSGLKPESLREYLFPHNLSFLIYADSGGEFVLGGLEDVFRNHLHWSLHKMDEEGRCVFDPPCRKEHGSCAVCMHLSENSCERFNTVLSRHYLFGGEHEGVRWKAFWKP